MFLTERAHQVVRAIAHFGHLDSGHVRSLFFEENRSNTPSDRTLQSLTKRGYIKPLSLRRDGRKIYALDMLGRRLFPSDTYKLPRLADIEHTLAIADTYVAARGLKDGGRYEVVEYATEPMNWQEIAGVVLRPDLYLEVGDHVRNVLMSWWVEVDLAHQRDSVITDKINRYYHAWQHTDSESFPLPTMPTR